MHIAHRVTFASWSNEYVFYENLENYWIVWYCVSVALIQPE
jgi:hypothetical protein